MEKEVIHTFPFFRRFLEAPCRASRGLISEKWDSYRSSVTLRSPSGQPGQMALQSYLIKRYSFIHSLSQQKYDAVPTKACHDCDCDVKLSMTLSTKKMPHHAALLKV